MPDLTLFDDVTEWFNRIKACAPKHTHGEQLGCTGVFAGWCPIHGDCICYADLSNLRDRVFDAVSARDPDRWYRPECPLHGD